MQQNIFIHYAQKSTQLAVCNVFRLLFVHKISISWRFGRATGPLHAQMYGTNLYAASQCLGVF